MNHVKEPWIELPVPRALTARGLESLFDARPLWESRKDRQVPYRQGEWFTLGAPMYLDGQGSNLSERDAKIAYFNTVLLDYFKDFYWKLLLDKNAGVSRALKVEGIEMLSGLFPRISLPGFHIFEAQPTAKYFFGRKHKDLQWAEFDKYFGFPFTQEQMNSHFSLTYVMRSPFMGSHVLVGDQLETRYAYTESMLYIHSGQFNHAIAPFQEPILPGDWRITLQAHGFVVNGKAYLYW